MFELASPAAGGDGVAAGVESAPSAPGSADRGEEEDGDADADTGDDACGDPTGGDGWGGSR